MKKKRKDKKREKISNHCQNNYKKRIIFKINKIVRIIYYLQEDIIVNRKNILFKNNWIKNFNFDMNLQNNRKEFK